MTRQEPSAVFCDGERLQSRARNFDGADQVGSNAQEMAVQKIGVVAFPGQQRGLVNLDEAGRLERGARRPGWSGRPGWRPTCNSRALLVSPESRRKVNTNCPAGGGPGSPEGPVPAGRPGRNAAPAGPGVVRAIACDLRRVGAGLDAAWSFSRDGWPRRSSRSKFQLVERTLSLWKSAPARSSTVKSRHCSLVGGNPAERIGAWRRRI